MTYVEQKLECFFYFNVSVLFVHAMKVKQVWNNMRESKRWQDSFNYWTQNLELYCHLTLKPWPLSQCMFILSFSRLFEASVVVAWVCRWEVLWMCVLLRESETVSRPMSGDVIYPDQPRREPRLYFHNYYCIHLQIAVVLFLSRPPSLSFIPEILLICNESWEKQTFGLIPE